MAAPHNIVHTNANENLAYLDAQNPKQEVLTHSNEIIASFDKMEAASEELFALLDQMLRETEVSDDKSTEKEV